MGSNIGTYLDQLWVSNIVKIKHNNKEVTNNPMVGLYLYQCNKTTILMDESREVRLTNAYKLILTFDLNCLYMPVLEQHFRKSAAITFIM